MSIQIYFKHKYTYENAGFCTDKFKILKFSNRLQIFHDFNRETSQESPPPPTSMDVSHGQNRYVTLPLILSVRSCNRRT